MAELAHGHRRCDGVADRHHEQLDHAERVDRAARPVEADEGGDAEDADSETGEPHPGQRVPVAEEVRDDRADDRDGGEHEAGEAARHAGLRMPEEHPRPGHLQQAERGHERPGLQRRSQGALACGERQQDRRAQQRAPAGHRHRAELHDGDLDEEVGDAPDHAHRGEQGPAPAGHPGAGGPGGGVRGHGASLRRGTDVALAAFGRGLRADARAHRSRSGGPAEGPRTRVRPRSCRRPCPADATRAARRGRAPPRAPSGRPHSRGSAAASPAAEPLPPTAVRCRVPG